MLTPEAAAGPPAGSGAGWRPPDAFTLPQVNFVGAYTFMRRRIVAASVPAQDTKAPAGLGGNGGPRADAHCADHCGWSPTFIGATL